MTVTTYHCPICTTALVPWSPQRYETISEHVCDPNGPDRGPRATLMCPNVQCVTWGKWWAHPRNGGEWFGNRTDVPDLVLTKVSEEATDNEQ